MRLGKVPAVRRDNKISPVEFFLKKVLASKKYSSALSFLSDQKARGKEINQWAALRAAPPTRGLELDTVLGSNLSKYITPELGLELSTLKEHLGINSFYVFQQ